MNNTNLNLPTMAAKMEIQKLIKRLELTDDEICLLQNKTGVTLKIEDVPAQRAIYCKELNKMFKNQRDAAKFFDCAPSWISQCLKLGKIPVKTYYSLEYVSKFKL